MTEKNLYEPIVKKKGIISQIPFKIPRWVPFVILFLPFVFVGIWIAVVDNPQGGEPRTIAQLSNELILDFNTQIAAENNQRSSGAPRQAEIVRNGPQVINLPDSGTAPSSSEESSGNVIKISTPEELNLENDVRLIDERNSSNVVLNKAPNRKLIEKTPLGFLPKPSSDGLNPAQYYARPSVQSSLTTADVAIIVTGMGLSQKLTEQAIKSLPSEVTFAFAPYANNLTETITEVREKGHEVLLQMPMEPFDYPVSDPGPHTLLTSLDAKANLQKLHWVMTRTTGYIGLINYMGAKYAATRGGAKLIVNEMKSRGLMFIEDGSLTQSKIKSEGDNINALVGSADLVIDQITSPDAIYEKLSELEALALKQGRAIGVLSVLPVSVSNLKEWLETIERRGVRLVPASSIVLRN